MKIHIVRPEQQSIEGYQRVEVGQNTLELNTIADNECTTILANDIADSFSVDKIGGMIMAVVQKLRLGGEIIIGGTDIRLFAKAVLNEQLPEIDACKMIGTNLSMSNSQIITEIINSRNLKVESVQLMGVHYEVTAKRV